MHLPMMNKPSSYGYQRLAVGMVKMPHSLARGMCKQDKIISTDQTSVMMKCACVWVCVWLNNLILYSVSPVPNDIFIGRFPSICQWFLSLKRWYLYLTNQDLVMLLLSEHTILSPYRKTKRKDVSCIVKIDNPWGWVSESIHLFFATAIPFKYWIFLFIMWHSCILTLLNWVSWQP